VSSPRFGIGALALVLAAGLTLTACAGGPDPETSGATHMGSHYVQVDQIQEAVIAGRLDDTRRPARWLATHQGREFPSAAAAALEMMRNEGRIMQEQGELLPVARTLGRMGVACGECHLATSAKVAFKVEEPPASSPLPQEHMRRHAWAVDRLWEGLAGPSDASWRAGAGALVHMPVDFGANDQANRLANRVHELADRAAAAATPKDRAQVYGDLLENCALCHNALRMRMR